MWTLFKRQTSLLATVLLVLCVACGGGAPLEVRVPTKIPLYSLFQVPQELNINFDLDYYVDLLRWLKHIVFPTLHRILFAIQT